MRGLHSGLAMAALVLSAGVAHPTAHAGFRDDPLPTRRRRMVPTRHTSTGGPWPHNGAREIARRLRQAERNAERQAARVDGHVYGKAWRNNGVVGISRRGRFIKAAQA